MAGGKIHHCVGKKMRGPNCRHKVKVPKNILEDNADSWYCPVHEQYCERHPDQKPFLKKQKCKKCLGQGLDTEEDEEGVLGDAPSSVAVNESERHKEKMGKGKGKGKGKGEGKARAADDGSGEADTLGSAKNSKRGKQGKRR